MSLCVECGSEFDAGADDPRRRTDYFICDTCLIDLEM